MGLKMARKKRKRIASRGSVNTIILKTLINGDKYGYEIIKEVEELSEGKIELNEGKPVISRVFVKCDGENILLNDTIFMEDVSKIEVSMNDKKLLTMRIWIVGNESNTPDYTTSAYCRLNSTPIPDEGGTTG